MAAQETNTSVFHRNKNKGSERLSNLPKGTQVSVAELEAKPTS